VVDIGLLKNKKILCNTSVIVTGQPPVPHPPG